MSLALTSPIAYAPFFTVAEFLDWPGDGLHHRHALIDGVPVPMDQPSVPHNAICGELYYLLVAHLRASRSDCRVLFGTSVQPRAGAAINLRVPDLIVVCAPLPHRIVENPLIAVEVLSPSNKSETREAVRACLSIPSLREVLVIDSLRIQAELLVRDVGGDWPRDPEMLRASADIVLPSIDFHAPLAALYRDLDLD